MQLVPQTAKDLLTLLKETHPPRCPTITESERAMFMYAGKVELVQWIEAILGEDED